jgi:hypothetical protein
MKENRSSVAEKIGARQKRQNLRFDRELDLRVREASRFFDTVPSALPKTPSGSRLLLELPRHASRRVGQSVDADPRTDSEACDNQAGNRQSHLSDSRCWRALKRQAEPQD